MLCNQLNIFLRYRTAAMCSMVSISLAHHILLSRIINKTQNMRNPKNICHIALNTCAITTPWTQDVKALFYVRSIYVLSIRGSTYQLLSKLNWLLISTHHISNLKNMKTITCSSNYNIYLNYFQENVSVTMNLLQ